MITIFIDNQPHQVKPDQNLLQACLGLGLDLPYFCWHPALHAVGACRQCAVKQFRDEQDRRGKIIMSCMTPVSEGMRISVDDPEARAFRKGVIEYLMLNHPHDCPICDEGGECHLQDMTVMTGHAYRRTRFPKRTHRNQDLGPFVHHEMNRCIQCYRCVRFYRDFAGGRDLNVFGCHDHVFFGRQEDGMLESPFSGNLVEVCPTGVFTDRTLRQHYARKWDLQTAPTVCVLCGVGCATITGERSGTLRRVLSRYSPEVNGYFLCDRGRFGHGFVNSGRRLRSALVASSPADAATALARIAGMLTNAKGVIGIGSPRASLESNFALKRLVGPARFFSGLADREHALVSRITRLLRDEHISVPALAQVRTADAVLVLGEDVTNTAPLLALTLRQTVRRREIEQAASARVPVWHDAGVRNAGQGRRNPVYIAAPYATPLDAIAVRTWHVAPDDIARLGFAVARELHPSAPEVPGLQPDQKVLAAHIAAALGEAKRPLIISGTSLGSDAVIQATIAVAQALRSRGGDPAVSVAFPECNTMGIGLLEGRLLSDAFAAVAEGRADTVIILENDLYRRADAVSVRSFLEQARQVIVLDHLENATTTQGHVVLPAATFAESTGTYVSSEGRAQRSFQVFAPSGDIRPSWKWVVAMQPPDTRTYDELVAGLSASDPLFRPVGTLAPDASFRLQGQKVPRMPHRWSGRTAVSAHIRVSEPRPPEDRDSALAFSMEGSEGRPPAALLGRYWAPGWNSVQALNKFQEEIAGPLRSGEVGSRLFPQRLQPGMPAPGPGRTIPAGYTPQAGMFLFVPLYRVHGSEELSSLSPGIQEIAATAALVVNPGDAPGISDNDLVEVAAGGLAVTVPVRLQTGMAPGVAGYPAGAAGFRGMTGTFTGTIRKVKDHA